MFFSNLTIFFRKNAHRNAKTHATSFFNILPIEDQAVKCQKSNDFQHCYTDVYRKGDNRVIKKVSDGSLGYDS
jgi:hypothetical protein